MKVSDRGPGHPRPLHPAAALGAVLFLVGVLAGVWLADWRWAVTGLVALLLGAVVAGVRG